MSAFHPNLQRVSDLLRTLASELRSKHEGQASTVTATDAAMGLLPAAVVHHHTESEQPVRLLAGDSILRALGVALP
jgi:hypothetical protein